MRGQSEDLENDSQGAETNLASPRTHAW